MYVPSSSVTIHPPTNSKGLVDTNDQSRATCDPSNIYCCETEDSVVGVKVVLQGTARKEMRANRLNRQVWVFLANQHQQKAFHALLECVAQSLVRRVDMII